MPFAFERLLERLYKRLGRAYFLLYAGFDLVSSLFISLGTIGLFSLYGDISHDDFIAVVLFSDLCVCVALVYTFVRVRRLMEPLLAWQRDGKPDSGALEAWRTAVSLPRDFVVCNGWQPFVIVAAPIAIFTTLIAALPWYSALIIFAGGVVAVAYAAILHFFASELGLRPVVRELSGRIPVEYEDTELGVPLRWKLLGALPLINVITGVVVSGLSTDGRASLEDLGVDVLVAVLVAFTLSFELTLLLTKSVLSPVRELLDATERVKQGDLSARVPVTSGDELGALAGNFNSMMKGLSERQALREALGSYVDPEVTERILEEGAMIEGQEVEVSVLFIDIRDFTAYAEHASAREAVGHLNDFFGLVVPLLGKHRGHANKFIGDGVLGVFGAPDRLPDHADRALAAAGEIATEVERRYGERLRIGIGVNSGPVLAGSVGGGGRLEFTVIGDPVNVASRLENVTKETGDAVLLTEATRCLLSAPDRDDLEPRDPIKLRGKSEPVGIWALKLAPVPVAPATAEASGNGAGDGRPADAETPTTA